LKISKLKTTDPITLAEFIICRRQCSFFEFKRDTRPLQQDNISDVLGQGSGPLAHLAQPKKAQPSPAQYTG